MNRAALARMLDHSVLKPESTERDIVAGADVVREWYVGYYCVQPCWVRTAAHALAGTDAVVASVVGFPSTSSAQPCGIASPFFCAAMMFPRATSDVARSILT